MKANLWLVLATIFFSFSFSSCEKVIDKDNTCDKIRSSTIYVEKTSYYVGEEIKFSTTEGTNMFYSWDHSSFSSSGMYSKLTISSCTKSHEGWYYLTVSNPNCTSKRDSVYITVKNKPGVAPCSPTNNQVSFSSIPNISFSAATWGYYATYNAKQLKGYQAFGYPDLNIYFHSYWNDKEPEDGEYSIHNTFSFTGLSPYHVYMTSLYSSILFTASTSAKVYVSHLNGKIQVTFCNVPFSGSLGGSPYTTTATGKLTAP